VIKTKLVIICRMEDYITLILHHSGDLVRNENRRVQYVGGEFCAREKIYVDLCVIFRFQFMCSGFFSLFCTHMFQGSI